MNPLLGKNSFYQLRDKNKRGIYVKKLLGLILIGMLVVSMAGCSSDTANTKDESKDSNNKVSMEKKEKTKKVDATNMVVDRDTMTFKFDAFKVIKDSDGNDALEIDYTFTNKQENATSALVGVSIDGYQKGKEMEVAIVNSNEFNEQINLKQNISQNNCRNYLVLRDNSDVELEVYETYGSAWEKNPAIFKISIKDGMATRMK
mgnify:CR=1 FL=1